MPALTSAAFARKSTQQPFDNCGAAHPKGKHSARVEDTRVRAAAQHGCEHEPQVCAQAHQLLQLGVGEQGKRVRVRRGRGRVRGRVDAEGQGGDAKSESRRETAPTAVNDRANVVLKLRGASERDDGEAHAEQCDG